MQEKRIRVRAAPSPTGFMHIGNLRTYIYDFLLAKKNHGDFILRIEDTDQTRFVNGATENLCQTLKRLGIEPSEGVWIDASGKIFQRGDYGPYIQSERKARHQKYAERLIDMDKAYYCFCTAERLDEVRKTQELTKRPTGYDGCCRNINPEEAKKRVQAGEEHVIRLKLPKEGKVTIHDAIRGDVTFDWNLIDDQVIIKSDGMATYHLAAMADDHDMEITHVIRGEEWLSSAPKHIFIYEAFGWDLPVFAHLPLILNHDKSKLSKRQGDVAVEDYLNKGYLPQALINFLALLGWNPKGDQEIYSIQELIDLFDLSKINKSGAIFQIDKLNWLNNHYLRQLPDDEFFSLVIPFLSGFDTETDLKQRIALLYRERLILPSEIKDLSAYLFEPKLDYSNVKITWKDRSREEAAERLQAAKKWIEELDDSKQFDAQYIEQTIKSKIQERGWGNGDTLWPLRTALSAQDKSPSPFELIAVLGKTLSINRIAQALAYLL